MNVHKNALLTPIGREIMVRRVITGQTPKAVATAFWVCVKTISKRIARFQAESAAGLVDRSWAYRKVFPHPICNGIAVCPVPSICVAEVEAIRAAWPGGIHSYAEATTPATSAQI